MPAAAPVPAPGTEDELCEAVAAAAEVELVLDELFNDCCVAVGSGKTRINI